jgi:hypothetical protein
VIVALATNVHQGSFEAARKLCEQIAPGHHLIFVTAHGVGDPNMAAISVDLRTLPGEFPFVAIADWDNAIAAHEDWLAADGYHAATPEAVDLYVQIVLEALEKAKTLPLSGDKPGEKSDGASSGVQSGAPGSEQSAVRSDVPSAKPTSEGGA